MITLFQKGLKWLQGFGLSLAFKGFCFSNGHPKSFERVWAGFASDMLWG